ncbi:MAG: DUF2283 domain-containing protein [Proteobacteria bacterium]|nr:DUF2283 domain-containing protein [candidate division Zixibacteria bacterium]NIQ40015.1 DUF2283 domain-containing protein [Pseudomonadota bacterium]
MKIAHYPETDSLYIDLSSNESVESKEVSPGVVLDYDSEGTLVGIDMDNASNKLDLRELVFNRIPTNKHTIAV